MRAPKKEKVVKTKTTKSKKKDERVLYCNRCHSVNKITKFPVSSTFENKTYQLFGCTICGNVVMMKID